MNLNGDITRMYLKARKELIKTLQEEIKEEGYTTIHQVNGMLTSTLKGNEAMYKEYLKERANVTA